MDLRSNGSATTKKASAVVRNSSVPQRNSLKITETK